MGGSCQSYWLLALQPQGVEHHRQTHWQVWTLLSPVPRLGKLHGSQLVKNGAQRTGGCESTRLTKELSDIWKVITPEGKNTSGPFKPEELAIALRRLKPGRSPGLDSIFPEFVLHAGSALKSWFCDYLTSCTRQPKIRKIWRKALIVVILSRKIIGVPKNYRPTSLLCAEPD